MDSRISARALTVLLGGWRTSEPAYEALADGVRLLTLDNRIPPLTALPAERELATALGVSRTTIAAAYRSLRESGHIRSVRGSGSVTEPLGRPAHARTAVSDPAAIDLQQASPAAWPGLPGVLAEAAQAATSILSRPGYDVVGNEELRRDIAARYSRAGLATDPGEILITNGAQSALHLLAMTLIGRGDRVLIETPTYPHAADCFRGAGARLVSVPVTTASGWELDRTVQAFSRTVPTVAYLMPDFQNPTGRSMSDEEREVIERAAGRAGTIVIVDETTAELDIDRRHAPRPFAPEGSGVTVVRVGSFGKTVWGGLRVGWIRANTDLIRRVVAARFAIELGTPEWEQLVSRILLPRLPEIIAQRAHVLRAGRDTAVRALRATLPEWAVPEVDGGVALWVGLDAPLSGALVMAARSHGLLLSAGPRFSVDGGYEANLRIPFTAPVAHMQRGVEILAAAWAQVRAGSAPVMLERMDAVV